MLHRYSDGAFVALAMVSAPPALVDALLRKPFMPPPGVPLDRMLRTKKVVHTLDAAAEENKPLSARLGGARRERPRGRRGAEQWDEFAAFHHSITSSAATSNVSVIVRSGAFAAFRLMTSS